MILEVFELIGAIIVTLIGCELFANAIEHMALLIKYGFISLGN